MTREEQIVHLDRAIQMAPARPYYYETRAVYEVDLRQFDRALDDLDRDVQLSGRPYARFLRGLVRCQSGEFSNSLADFDAAIAGQPANTQFYRGRSLARAASGDAVGALDDAEHLVATAPQMAESFYARGVALRRGRNPDLSTLAAEREESDRELPSRRGLRRHLGNLDGGRQLRAAKQR